MKERKRVPKTVTLAPEVYVKSTPATNGLQIVIAGTGLKAAAHESHIFFAVYNTYYNTTEFLSEEAYKYPEVVRGVEIAENSPHCIVLGGLLFSETS